MTAQRFGLYQYTLIALATIVFRIAVFSASAIKTRTDYDQISSQIFVLEYNKNRDINAIINYIRGIRCRTVKEIKQANTSNLQMTFLKVTRTL